MKKTYVKPTAEAVTVFTTSPLHSNSLPDIPGRIKRGSNGKGDAFLSRRGDTRKDRRNGSHNIWDD